MAIVKMKRLYLIAMKEDKDNLLKLLQKMACVEINDANSEINNIKKETQITNNDIERLKWAIDFLSKNDKSKKPMFASDKFVSRSKAIDILNKEDDIFNQLAKIEDLEREIGRISSDRIKLNAMIDDFKPWTSIDANLSDIKATNNTMQSLAYIQNTSLAKLNENEALKDKLIYMETINNISGVSYMYVVIHQDDIDSIVKSLKDYGFTFVQFNDVDKSATDKINEINHEISELNTREEELKNELAEHAKDLNDFQLLYDVLNLKQQRETAKGNFVSTSSSIFLKGWVPASMEEELVKNIKNLTKNVEIEIKDPEPDDEPPVMLKNNKIATPFESVVMGFSYPSPEGMDPTSLMMPFFANFFGMMLSDAGYGLIMLLALPIIIKRFNPKTNSKNMMKLLMWGAFTTIIWGALYNTWFGFAPFPSVFDPINKPMPVMIICIALGAVHLLAGLAAAAYINIKHGDYLAVIYDQLSWALLLMGLGMMIVPSVANIGKILAISGAAIILLMAGREKKNVFARLMSGVGAMYNIMGWISDLLSYMRLFGMGLATGVIGMVINKLIGMIFQGGIVGIIIGSVLFVGAHLFNLGINALGAYVHSCRLQYIEFFGKFYQDGGKLFVPLEENTRFVRIVDENNNNVHAAQI